MTSNERATQRLFGLGCVVLALAACQPSMEEVISQHREPVQAVFEKIKSLQATVQDTPPVTEDRMVLGPAHVVLEGDNENALFIRAENLHAPELASSDGLGATYAGTIEVCGEALDGRFNGAPVGAQRFLDACARAEYLFVMRTYAEEWASTVDDQTFRPGSYAGDVLLLRIADGALLGGFRVSATNNDTVTTQLDASGESSNANERLESDLGANVFMAIADGMRKYVPGALPAQ